MEHKLADAGLRMTYLRDPYRLDELNQDAILRDLSDHGPANGPLNGSADRSEERAIAQLGHRDLSDYDHLILASDIGTRQTRALLGMREGGTEREDFLLLESAFVARSVRGRRLMERMIALALLRVAGCGPVPQVIVARTSNPGWYRSLRQFSRRFRGAVFFPEHDSPTVRLDSVRLARRIARQVAPELRFESGSAALRGGRISAGLPSGRAICSDPRIETMFGHLRPADQMLVMIDLRAQCEDTILDSARRIYRSR